jgi:putative flippase GtrA
VHFVRSLRARYARLAHTARYARLANEVAKFGAVGAAAFVVDFGVFNLAIMPSSPLHHKVLTAKAVSTTLAATFSYFANRHWTWRLRARSGLGREYSLFFVFNAVGLGIMEACLAISRYGLGLTSALANNVSAYGFGLVLGTLFRFWAYRRWVFLDTDEARGGQRSRPAAAVRG